MMGFLSLDCSILVCRTDVSICRVLCIIFGELTLTEYRREDLCILLICWAQCRVAGTFLEDVFVTRIHLRVCNAM